MLENYLSNHQSLLASSECVCVCVCVQLGGRQIKTVTDLIFNMDQWFLRVFGRILTHTHARTHTHVYLNPQKHTYTHRHIQTHRQSFSTITASLMHYLYKLYIIFVYLTRQCKTTLLHLACFFQNKMGRVCACSFWKSLPGTCTDIWRAMAPRRSHFLSHTSSKKDQHF